MAGNREARFPPPCPVRVGGGPRAKPTYCTTTLAAIRKKKALFDLANILVANVSAAAKMVEASSLGGD